VKQSHKTLLLWVVLIVMFLAIWQFLSPQQARDVWLISFDPI